jgi:hypothetical protein
MNKSFFGKSKDGKTTIIGDPDKPIKVIYVEKKGSDPLRFTEGFSRILALKELKNSDFQRAIKEIFSYKKEDHNETPSK